MSESDLHFASAILFFLSAIVPLYLGISLKKDLRRLTFVLSGFILVHGTYHILGYLGYDYLSENVFEPLSIAVLIAFGIMYLFTRKVQVVRK